MTVPRKPKPEEAAETARVMRIFDWLVEELQRRYLAHVPKGDVLAVAERIAARTESV